MLTHAQAVALAHIPRKHTRSKSLKYINDMQNMLHRDVMAEETTPVQRAQAARAWKELEEQRHQLMQRPLARGVALRMPVKVKQGGWVHRTKAQRNDLVEASESEPNGPAGESDPRRPVLPEEK